MNSGMVTHNTPKSLENEIIKFSVGIGTSFEEASQALMEAKEKGNREDLMNINIYQGEPLQDSPIQNQSNAQYFMQVLNYLRETNASEDLIAAQERLSIDSKTGLFNKLGYETKRLELDELGQNEGYFVLLDGNSMHDHNAIKGYTLVDRYLEASGEGILRAAIDGICRSVRSGYDRRENEDMMFAENEARTGQDRRVRTEVSDIVAHRVNDSAGDEFLLYLPGLSGREGLQIAKIVAERALKTAYHMQIQIADEVKNPLEVYSSH